jgi:hypothetical protein
MRRKFQYVAECLKVLILPNGMFDEYSTSNGVEVPRGIDSPADNADVLSVQCGAAQV